MIGVFRRGSSFPSSDAALWMLPPPDVNLKALPINVVRLRDNASVVDADKELSVLSAATGRARG